MIYFHRELHWIKNHFCSTSHTLPKKFFNLRNPTLKIFVKSNFSPVFFEKICLVEVLNWKKSISKMWILFSWKSLICPSMVAESGLHANIKVIKYSKEIFDLNLNFNWNLNQLNINPKIDFKAMKMTLDFQSEVKFKWNCGWQLSTTLDRE